jgi:hypothetical protein
VKGHNPWDKSEEQSDIQVIEWTSRRTPNRFGATLRLLDRDLAEGDGIVVACETEVARVGGVRHEVLRGGQVGVEDDGAVEFDLDLRAWTTTS